MTTIAAEPILISENIDAQQTIVTLRLTYPRFIHAEFMTHRSISKNAASSRAIPVTRMIERVKENPAIPIYWGKNKKGMQADEEIDDAERFASMSDWRDAMSTSIRIAESLAARGVHKQVVNRLLEPFAHMTTLATATQTAWEGLLYLRDHSDAEPHFRQLARRIAEALRAPPQTVRLGEWHLPFIRPHEAIAMPLFERQVLSIARCAHVSYDTVDGYAMDYERAQRIVRDMVRAERLHASPLEHQARAAEATLTSRNFDGGWMQMRQLYEMGQFRRFRL